MNYNLAKGGTLEILAEAHSFQRASLQDKTVADSVVTMAMTTQSTTMVMMKLD